MVEHPSAIIANVLDDGHGCPEDEMDAAWACVQALQRARDRAFTEGNDKVWGEGNWIRCDLISCQDLCGWATCHHKAFHNDGPSDV